MNENNKRNFKWNVKWEIKERAPPYEPGNKDCKLCVSEKYHILNEDDNKSLNVRSELLSKCRHKAKWKLKELLTYFQPPFFPYELITSMVDWGAPNSHFLTTYNYTTLLLHTLTTLSFNQFELTPTVHSNFFSNQYLNMAQA